MDSLTKKNLDVTCPICRTSFNSIALGTHSPCRDPVYYKSSEVLFQGNLIEALVKPDENIFVLANENEDLGLEEYSIDSLDEEPCDSCLVIDDQEKLCCDGCPRSEFHLYR